MSEQETPSEEPNIVPVRIAEEMRTSYLDYAMSVIIGRALPDVRDGLKPVHRRILYSMYENGNSYNRSYKKSARIVGDVIGKYHPHGDSAVYDALVRMAQDFSMRMLLVDGQGNFGSVDGDSPAAMRYTEVRMTRATSELLADIEKETVDFIPNYDEQEEEPTVLPTRIPNLLVNGSEGIAVGMATKIPPHNLKEVVTACIYMVENQLTNLDLPEAERKEVTLDELMEIVPAPDFPTGGILYGMDGVRSAYECGRGVVRIRAVTDIEVNEKSGKESIIVHELPYQVNKARLLEKIAALVREKAVEGITDLRDESDRKGMRVVIELRRDVNSQVTLNQLFKKTQLETSFGINMVAIVSGQPRTLGLQDILGYFIDFRRDVVIRRCLHELRKAEGRMHILDGIKRALDMVDEVIRTIRASADAPEARLGLMALLDIDADQAQAILDLRLQKLTSLEINKVVEEIEELSRQIARLKEILENEGELLGVIRTELAEILDAYGNLQEHERRTQVLQVSGELTIEDLIANEDEVVTLSHSGYIKRTQLDHYRTQRRGGKGLRGMQTKDEDFVENVWVTNTHASLLFFTSVGKVYRIKVHELPAGGRNSKGKPAVNLLPIEAGEKIQAVVPFEDFDEGRFIVTATRSGLVKKTALVAYKNIHAGGIIGVVVPEGDELLTARMCEPTDRIFLVSKDGQSIQFPEDDVRPTGRATQGVRGIKLREADEVVSLVIIPREELLLSGLLERTEDDAEPEEGLEARKMLTITEKGYGKRTPIPQYPVQGRGGLGVITIKTSDRNGPVAGSRLVATEDELIIITNRGKIIRIRVDGISELGRNTQGVRLIRLDDGERVVGVARYESEDDDELEEGAEAEAGETEDRTEAPTESTVTEAADAVEDALDTSDGDETGDGE